MAGWDRLTVYLESKLGERLREYCHRNRMKLTEFVRQAVEEKLEREEENERKGADREGS